MPEDFLPTDYFTFASGAWAVRALHFPAFLVDGLTPELPATTLDESAPGALTKIGTGEIG
jgi:hypothetical protein